MKKCDRCGHTIPNDCGHAICPACSSAEMIRILDEPDDSPDERAGAEPLFDVEPETRIPGFVLEELIAEGGMGLVYRATQLSPKRVVALKMLHCSRLGSKEARMRFRREVLLAGRLSHPNIASVYESGMAKEEGILYFTMEFVKGVPIDQYVRDHELSQRETLILFRQICSAIVYTHYSKTAHRDLKPSNILVDFSGKCKIVDFGLGKSEEPLEDEEFLTFDGTLQGTPSFMSPEQALVGEPVDLRTDIYSLGVILYLLLTGKLPHDSTGTPMEVMKRVAEDEPRRASKVVKDFDGELEAILTKALQKKPEDRYPTVAHFSDDLENYLKGRPIKARKQTGIYRIQKAVRRNLKLVAITLAIALIGAILAATYVISIRNYAKTTKDALEKSEARLEQTENLLSFQVLDAVPPLIDAGQHEMARDFVRNAELHFSEFSDEEMNPTMLRIRAVATAMRGQTALDERDFEKAESALKEAIEMLTKVPPENARQGFYYHDIGISYNKLASIQLNQARPEAATEHLAQATKIWDELFSFEDLGDHARMRAIRGKVSTLRALGTVAAQRDEHEKAMEFFEEASRRLRPLAGKSLTDVPPWCEATEALGKSASKLGMHEKALAALASALQGRQLIVQQAPKSAAAKHALAWSHGKMADALRRKGDLKDAKKSAMRGDEIYTNHLEAGGEIHPAGIHDFILCKIITRLGEAFEEEGSIRDTRDCFEKAMEYHDRIRARKGDDHSKAELLNLVEHRVELVRVLVSSGKTDHATKHTDMAESELAQLIEKIPNEKRVKRIAEKLKSVIR